VPYSYWSLGGVLISLPKAMRPIDRKSGVLTTRPPSHTTAKVGTLNSYDRLIRQQMSRFRLLFNRQIFPFSTFSAML